jgi:hypothetical protein
MLASCHTVHLSTPILLKCDRAPSMLRYYDIMCFMENVGSVMAASEAISHLFQNSLFTIVRSTDSGPEPYAARNSAATDQSAE